MRWTYGSKLHAREIEDWQERWIIAFSESSSVYESKSRIPKLLIQLVIAQKAHTAALYERSPSWVTVLVHGVEVTLQLVLPGEAIDSLAVAAGVRTVEVFDANLVSLHMAVEVATASDAGVTIDMRAGNSTGRCGARNDPVVRGWLRCYRQGA